ncbi:MAG: hypothetical protein K2K63_06260 [Acetatifactor sp.]|nr:hypothetical protein [Acetatifactor sp.]
MKTDKELGAIRVMEALSAVDEELLERSGKTAVESKNRMTVRRFVQRYAVACAACLCLMVLGAAYFGMSQMRMGSAKDSDGMSMNSGGTGNNSGLRSEEKQDAMPEEMLEYVAEGAAGGSIYDYGTSAPIEPEWLDVEHLAELPDATVAREPAAAEKENTNAETVKENDRVQSADKSSGSDGAVMQSAPEAAVPERYSPVEPEAGRGEQDSLLYEWSDGEKSLWLRITQTELTVDLRFDAQPPVYTVQEEWKELIPDAGADGYIQFALLYDNGMLAEYCGALEREEIISLMESLAW